MMHLQERAALSLKDPGLRHGSGQGQSRVPSRESPRSTARTRAKASLQP